MEPSPPEKVQRIPGSTVGLHDSPEKPITVSAEEAGLVRYRYARVYDKNICQRVAAARTLEQLEQIRAAVLELAKAGRIKGRTLRRIEAAGANRYRELSEALIVAPPEEQQQGALFVPNTPTMPVLKPRPGERISGGIIIAGK